MPRLSAVVVVALFAASAAVAQQPTVTAEATELVRVKPDSARVYLTVETRHANADTSADDHADAVKRAVDDLKGLRLKGVTVTPQQSLSARVDGAGPRSAVYVNASTLRIAVADLSPEQLTETVTKVQQEAGKLGLGGTPQVAFEKKDGWDEAVAPAVAKATRRAVQKAELLATSAGLKPGTVLAVSDGSEAPTATDDAVAYTDGELVRKVRVKVVIAATLPK